MNTCFSAIVLSLLLAPQLLAAPYLEDAITNTAVGNNLGSAAPWTASSSQIKVASGNLTNAALQPLFPAGNLASIAGTSGGSSYRTFNGNALYSGVLYYSFLLQCTSLPTSGDKYLTGFLPSGTSGPGGSSDPLAVYFRLSGTGYQLGIRKSGASAVFAAPVHVLQTTNFVVARYAFGGGTGDDVVSLYLNPTPGAPEPATPHVTLTGGTDAGNLQNIYLKSSSGYGIWNVDTLRVGSSWADVTPALDAPVPASGPSITRMRLDRGGIVLEGTNGTAGSLYQVIGSSSIAHPRDQWFAVTTNTFDVYGNFVCTNAIDPGDGHLFYAVLVGGQAPPRESAPVIRSQPTDQVVVAGQDATFTVVVSGKAPLGYQWYYNTNVLLSGRTNSTLPLTQVGTNDAGAYWVIVSNAFGQATSSVAKLTISQGLLLSAYNLAGFAQATTGGGMLAETDPGYFKAYDAVDLAVALSDKQGIVKVIEIMNDLDLGYNEIPAAAKTNSEPFRAHASPLLHPVLLNTGVSLLDIQKKYGLTIFSANGATIRHATFNIKSAGNIIVRNLKFDQMWEWDESSKGDYDRNDWDFIDLGNGGTVSNIWIDHCTFTKAYDGIADIKQGSYNITFSWCKYTGDDGATNTNSWVRQQIYALEANQSAYPMYSFLRNNGFSTEDIVTTIQGHDKTHLIGATTDAINAQHTVTFHHDWFSNPWDRLPRLRAGNVHNYNLYVDDTLGLAARRLRDAREAAMSATSSNTLNSTYNFKPFLNGSISTEGGAVLVEKSVYVGCLTPLRNNQTDPNNPTYTGKILALDTIYEKDGTTVRGDSTTLGNPLGPFQAPIIPFSWNLPGNQLPYSYVMDDPSQLAAILTDPNFGAGAGVLNWAKTNWLKTTY